jgi:hypothetical protein
MFVCRTGAMAFAELSSLDSRSTPTTCCPASPSQERFMSRAKFANVAAWACLRRLRIIVSSSSKTAYSRSEMEYKCYYCHLQVQFRLSFCNIILDSTRLIELLLVTQSLLPLPWTRLAGTLRSSPQSSYPLPRYAFGQIPHRPG